MTVGCSLLIPVLLKDRCYVPSLKSSISLDLTKHIWTPTDCHGCYTAARQVNHPLFISFAYIQTQPSSVYTAEVLSVKSALLSVPEREKFGSESGKDKDEEPG